MVSSRAWIRLPAAVRTGTGTPRQARDAAATTAQRRRATRCGRPPSASWPAPRAPRRARAPATPRLVLPVAPVTRTGMAFCAVVVLILAACRRENFRTPSCWMNSRLSASPQYSANLPSAMRRMSVPVKVTSRPTASGRRRGSRRDRCRAPSTARPGAARRRSGRRPGRRTGGQDGVDAADPVVERLAAVELVGSGTLSGPGGREVLGDDRVGEAEVAAPQVFPRFVERGVGGVGHGGSFRVACDGLCAAGDRPGSRCR